MADDDDEKTFKYIATDLPSDISRIVGDIIYKSSRIQFGLTILIAHGFDIPEDTSRALTIGMEMHVLTSILRTLAFNDRWIKDETIRKQIIDLADDIKKLAEWRNTFAHGIFVLDAMNPESLEKYLVKNSSQRITPELKKVELEQLTEVASKANDIDLFIHFIMLKLKIMKQQASAQKSP